MGRLCHQPEAETAIPVGWQPAVSNHRLTVALLASSLSPPITNYPASFMLLFKLTGKVTESITLACTGQPGYQAQPAQLMKGRSCLTNLIFYKLTCLVDEGRAVNVVYLHFSTWFPTAFSWGNWFLGLDVCACVYSLLCEKLAGWQSSKSSSEWS